MKCIAAFGAALLIALSGTAAFAAPVSYVRICPTNPHQYIVPGTDTCVDGDAGNKAERGVAIDMSMPAATVDAGKTFGAGVHVGTFDGQTAVGIGGAVRATDGVTFDGAVGFATQGGVGGRAGMNVSW